MFKKILVPLDGSDLAEKALPYAQSLAQQYKAQLMLVRVLPAMVITPHQTQQPYNAEILQNWEEASRQYLNEVKQKLIHASPNIKAELLAGEPVAEMLLELACDNNIDLIVMSTHGYTGNRRWVYGSVANKLLQGAPCPIFLVRATEAECN